MPQPIPASSDDGISPRPVRPGAAYTRARPVERLLLAGVPIASVVALTGLLVSGELSPALLLDPGPVVRFGLPVARVVHDLAAALTVGLLLLAVLVLPGNRDRSAALGFLPWTACRWALVSATLWFGASSAVLVLTAANSIGTSPAEPGFLTQLVFYASQIELGQSLLVSAALVASVIACVSRPRSPGQAGLALILALGALFPLALAGHSAGSEDHTNAVNSLGLHLVGACVWVGGLAALVALRARLGPELPRAVDRYSRLALAGYVLVVVSGVINASLRLQTPGELFTTTYGNLLLLKVIGLVILGGVGWRQRSGLARTLRAGSAGRWGFVRMAALELVIMAVAIGASVALTRSAPPVARTPVTDDVRLALLGFPYPPPLDGGRYLLEAQVDWLFVLVLASLVGFYLAGVRRLRRRGVGWQKTRTLAWLSGCVLLLFLTSGGAAVYGAIYPSTHVLQHVGLTFYVPLALVAGAPTRLALEVLQERDDGSRGAREWLEVIGRSRTAALLTRPGMVAILIPGSLAYFYFGGWYSYALAEHPGHLAMQVFFPGVGALLYMTLLGRTGAPQRSRAIVAGSVLVGLGLLALAVIQTGNLLGQPWWTAMQYVDPDALLLDQRRGAWYLLLGSVVPIVCALVLGRRHPRPAATPRSTRAGRTRRG